MKDIKYLNYAIRFIIAFIGVSLFILELKGAGESGVVVLLKGSAFFGLALMFLLEVYSMVRKFSWHKEVMRERLYLILKVLIWLGATYYFAYIGVNFFLQL